MNSKYSPKDYPFPYRILAFDLDGTVLDDEKKMHPSTYSALMEVQRAGMTLLIASGRPTYGCAPIARQLQLDKYGGYLMSYNGGKITSCADGQVLGRKTIPTEVVRELYDAIKDREGVSMITYTREEIIAEDKDNPYVQAESEVDFGMPIREVPSLPDAITRAPFKCALVGDKEALLPLKVELESRFERRLTFFVSAEYFIEVVPTGVDKGYSLDFLLQDLHLTRKEVIAVGDNYNDLRMLQVAGLGVAMANATEAVKRVADYVTLSNNEDGIRHFINKHLLYPEEKEEPVSVDLINRMQKNTLMESLGITVTKLAEGYVEATMPVDRRTRQPMGILHGGASLALAETLAGYGSIMLLKNNEIQVGMQVSGNHIRAAHEGDVVKGVATIIHRGRSTHIWNVDILSEADEVVCSVRVLNSVLKRR